MFFQLKITLRNLWHGGLYSAINIGGLAIGMAATIIIIMLRVYHQWSYDRFHAKEKYLYKLWCYIAKHTKNRRKEIGIRQVLGASIFDIVSLLSKEFLVLVTVSLFIALPFAWWVMNQWLSGYAYRTTIPWWLLIAVAVLTIGIALATISWQALKAAMANPVESIMNGD